VEIKVGDRKPTRYKKQPAVRRVTEPSAHMTCSVKIIFVGSLCCCCCCCCYWWWRSDASAVRVGPTELAFEAKNELVVLPIVAGERAADHAIGRDTILGYNSVFFDMRPHK